MKLTVDIPVKLYKAVKEKEYCHTYAVDKINLFDAVKKGTVQELGDWEDLYEDKDYAHILVGHKCCKCGYITKDKRTPYCPNCGEEKIDGINLRYTGEELYEKEMSYRKTHNMFPFS